MPKLLKCQEDEYNPMRYDSGLLREFGVALLCHLLDIFESDLSTDESRDIETFCVDWSKE